ncbi:hypothetical protein LY632_00315 [Erythrobacter sp. SDW2]|uniref:hypothetical protein n=1 Tax=Erythrobacter sp. SDW2 TaxID=2907154 RepID=UPI001F350A35|nr:hypothetical protein [Erythrobacter sp. SDW2]UIP06879.1 hypothetical protein LY632_00315 [Erythrobacter sp. SDW2]
MPKIAAKAAEHLDELLAAVDLDDEVETAKALVELGRSFRDKADQVKDFDSAGALVKALAEGTRSDAVKAAFAAIGEEDLQGKLAARAEWLEQAFAKVDSKGGDLLRTLDQFGDGAERGSGKLAWPLLKQSASGGGNAGGQVGYDFAFTSELALDLEAAAKWSYTDQLAGPLMRIGASGRLEASGGATLPFTGGSAGLKAGVSARPKIDYFYAVKDRTTLFAEAVAGRLGKLPNPFDYDAVWDGFTKGDLAGLHWQFEGAASIGLGLTVAKAFSIRDAVGVDLGATVDAKASINGLWNLSLQRAPGFTADRPRILAILSRERTGQAEMMAKLGAEVDISKLATKIHGFLDEALAGMDEALAELRPFLSPGTYLLGQGDELKALVRAEAEKLVGNYELKQALARDLQGVVGVGEPDESELVAWLTERLGGGLDAGQGWLSDKGRAVTNALKAMASQVPALGQKDFIDELTVSLETLIGKNITRLRETVDAMIDDKGEQVEQALDKLGLKVGKWPKDKAKQLDDAFASVRALVERYEGLFRKVLEKAKAAADAKISAAIQVDLNRTDRKQVEFQGTFLVNSDHARMVFQALSRGDFDALTNVILENTSGGHDAEFDLDEGETRIARFSESKRNVGYEFLAFGFGVSGNALLSAKAEVIVDGYGNIEITTEAEIRKRGENFFGKREISLINSQSLSLARVTTHASPLVKKRFGFALHMSHVDTSLVRSEVTAFVRSLCDGNLLGTDAVASADAAFSRWSASAASGAKIEGRLDLRLSLDHNELLSLMEMGSGNSSIILSDARRIAIANHAFRHQREHLPKDAQLAASAIAFFEKHTAFSTFEESIYCWERSRGKLLREGRGPSRSELSNEDKAFVGMCERANGIWAMIEAMREIYLSSPEITEDNDPRTLSYKDFRRLAAQGAKAVEGWLAVQNSLFWSDASIHPKVIAFLHLVGDLANIPVEQRLSLTLSRTGPGDPETLVLVGA